MKIELISIGDELLKGRIVNTNAAFLSRHLRQNGYAVARQTTISDERQELIQGLREALSRADLVITTGGLGPTLDDRTREVVCELFQCGTKLDQGTFDDLKKRYGDRFDVVKNQATVPEKSRIVYNRVGSAPGLFFSEGGKTLILMPGVPKEMEPMFLEQVLPLIEKNWPVGEKKQMRVLHFCLVFESLLDPHLRTLSGKYPAVEAGIYPSHGALCVSLLSADPTQLASFEKELLAVFGDYHFPQSSVEEALLAACTSRKKKVAFAESCTGGMMSALVTSAPGASDYFLGSFVVYSNGMKEELLGVSSQTLNKKGAVSAETVREMLAGIFQKTNADFGVAVSGIAGPAGGTPDKPVGTAWAAIGERGKPPEVGTFRSYGSRQTIILISSHYLLGALWRKIEKGISAFPLIKKELEDLRS